MAEALSMKRIVTLNLDAELVNKAEALGMDLVAAAEAAVTRLVRDAEQSVESEAAEAVRAWNDYDRRYLAVADEFGAA